jgi:arylsulfatase A-like enzyme
MTLSLLDVLLLAPLGVLHAGEASPPPSRPNVIVLITDDQGYGDLGCHGNPIMQTPHMDRLGRESVRFSNFHVDSYCSIRRSRCG